MDKLTTSGKWWVAIVVLIIVVAAIGSLVGKSNPAPAMQGGDNGAQATTTGSPTTGTSAGGAKTPPRAPTPAVIHFITPVVNDNWRLSQSNPIAWDNEAGVTGEIQLIDANTHAIVGVILSETGPHQTSYAWDTRQIILARYSPVKKDIGAGTYAIRIKFDGNNLPTITSPSFTISP